MDEVDGVGLRPTWHNAAPSVGGDAATPHPDQLEKENLRRHLLLRSTGPVIEEAARKADAYLRLEQALRNVDPEPVPGDEMSPDRGTEPV
jgi:hypothetical protein